MAGFLESLATSLGKKKAVKLTSYAQSKPMPTQSRVGSQPAQSRVTSSQVSKVLAPKMSIAPASQVSKYSTPKLSSSSTKKKSSNPLVKTAYAQDNSQSIPSSFNGTNSSFSLGKLFGSPIGYQGVGNWGTPELGITEAMGGNRNSLLSAPNNAGALTSYLGNMSGPSGPIKGL
jgi:hypothetical protein